MEQSFYRRLHAENPAYGVSAYDIRKLFRNRAFSAWCKRVEGRELRILDIGCGKGQFLLELSRHFRGASESRVVRPVGLDLVRAERNVFAQIGPEFEFFQQSVDGKALPFEEEHFDLVSCNHVLEHLFQTEKFLREIHRVVRRDGLAVISVPNIAAWMNRIAFLVGGQPLGSELGTEKVSYGFWPQFLKPRLEQFTPSGHIRDFTPGGLRDLAVACGFKHLGWWAQSEGLLPSLNPRLGRNIGLLLEPVSHPL